MNLLAKWAMMSGLAMSCSVYAQAPAGAPAGATGLCKDGTYHTGPTKSGACSGHKGVKDWYDSLAAKAPASAPAAPVPASAAPTARTTTPAAATPAAAALTAPKAMPKPADVTAAAGGGAGQVWVNPKSKVYHCQSDKWYGKTKAGQYMTEAAAKAAGNHGDHGKVCS